MEPAPHAAREAVRPGVARAGYGAARAARAGYGGAVALATPVVCALAIRHAPAFGALPVTFWLMAVLVVAVDAVPFPPPFQPLGRPALAVCPSICFTFAILLTWGLVAAVAVQTAAVVGSAAVTRRGRQRVRLYRLAFTAGRYAVSFAAAAAILSVGPAVVPAVICAAAAFFLVNAVLEATATWLRNGARRTWSGVFARVAGGEAVGICTLLLAPVVAAAAQVSGWLVPLVLPPLYAVHRMARLAGDRARLAGRDPLTGLADRRALERTVAGHLAAHGERAAGGAPDRRVALLLVDLDRFKHVNDALGHAVGDRLLVEVGRRLTRLVQPGELVARLGGDEFALVVPGLPDIRAARAQAARVVRALAEPVLLDGLPLDVTGSIGIAVYPEHGIDFATLMQHADVAMYDAKHRGDSVAVYAPESDHNTPERLALLADLRTALAGEATGIALYYQPQVDMATGTVVGLEALLRWRHPERGLVDPEELIRVAEHSAVMRLLTLRVLDEVFGQLARWAGAAADLRVAVNVSVRDLHSADLADWIAGRLARYGVRPAQLQLEITEGALMADPRRVLATLSRLRQLGVSIALDDFGTGYSSMLHLRRLPLSEVKIDRSFVLGASNDEDDATIVRSMIELAGALGLRVVAEGVEDDRTWRMLAAAGCDLAQGWFCARPMPADELMPWLRRYRARAGQPATPATPATPGAAAR